MSAGRTNAASPLAGLLPYHVIPVFLGAEMVAGLLGHALASEVKFRPTKLYTGVDPKTWNSLTTHDLGPYDTLLREKMCDTAPALFDALKLKPFSIASIEVELIAYKDGAFSSTHVDLVTRAHPGRSSDRVISAAYYFFREPKGFTGGALRFHPPIEDEAHPVFADVEPVNDTLVAFPAFAPHEVLPVHCPSGVFADCRFALYFGVHRAR